jgi:hypothetical protein
VCTIAKISRAIRSVYPGSCSLSHLCRPARPAHRLRRTLRSASSPVMAERERGYRRDFHRLPAQPLAATSLISSTDEEGPSFLLNILKTSEILPVRAAFIAIRPSGSLSTVARMHSKMLQKILAERNLPFCGDFESTHGIASSSQSRKVKLLTIQFGVFA